MQLRRVRASENTFKDLKFTRKARRRALFSHCAGPKVQDIFDTREDTGEDFETAADKLLEYFQTKKTSPIEHIPVSAANSRERGVIR